MIPATPRAGRWWQLVTLQQVESDAPGAPPVVCRLDADEARAQVDEWQELLSARSSSTQRTSATELLVRIDPDRVADAVGLAQREAACCPFFAFSLQIDADALTLRVTVPDEASVILDRLDAGRPAAGTPEPDSA